MPNSQRFFDVNIDPPNWVDLVTPASAINPAGPVAPPIIDNTDGSLLFRNGQTDTVAFLLQIPHGYYPHSNINFHIHWSKVTSAVGTVKWQAQFAWANNGEIMPAFSVLADGAVVIADADTAGLIAVRAWDINGGSKVISSILKVWLQRTSAAGGDTYANNAKLLSADLHVRVDTIGSKSEWTKP